MAQVKDLVTEVGRKLANRTDIDAAPFWIRDAVLELTESMMFEELKVIGPDKILTTNEPRYLLKDFIQGNNELTKVVAFIIYIDYPTNSLTKILKFRETMAILPMTRTAGLPSYWTRHGEYIYLASKPNQTYTVQMLYQLKHPFDSSSLDALKQQTILMPDSWLEVAVLAAAERGATELRMPDYVSLYHNILYGDPKAPDEIGLIAGRKLQHQRDKGLNEQQMQPIVRRYC